MVITRLDHQNPNLNAKEEPCRIKATPQPFRSTNRRRKHFDAIRNVRGWWSEEIEGSTAKVGDEFKYHYQNLHTCTMKLVELVPDKRVAWLVTDNYFSFTEDKTEWKGTKVIFDIAKKGEQDRDPLHA